MAFWRRSKGRHALGAAVTSVPSAPRPPAPLPAVPLFAAPAYEAPAFEPAAYEAATPVEWSFPELVAPEPVAQGPRVELTFRDGSRASLDPVQARALDEIAQVLTRRD